MSGYSASIPGSKRFGRRGEPKVAQVGRENQTTPRPCALSCGHTQLYKVLPRKGDFVYCRRCQDFVEVPGQRQAEAA